ncbi:MAG: type II toxin-antitoxin system RelE/ParE family toxin [Flavobacteriaceae bacterium]|nr:type II toxin-antitoxin system RelE/ParE family toxin [Flavobacteriaceae bacterium]
MAKRNIVWARTADLQFVGVLEYWVKKNKSNNFSKKLLKLVTERTLQITAAPFIYKSTNFKDVRVASLRNFSIYYKITTQQIIVMAFWDNRQDPKKLLRILQNEK